MGGDPTQQQIPGRDTPGSPHHTDHLGLLMIRSIQPACGWQLCRQQATQGPGTTGESTSQSLSLLIYKMGLTINSYILQGQDVQEMIDVEMI